MATGVAEYSDLPQGAKVVGYSDLPKGAKVAPAKPQATIPTEAQAAAHPPIAPLANTEMHGSVGLIPSDLYSQKSREGLDREISAAGGMHATPIAPSNIAGMSAPAFVGSLIGGYGGSQAGDYISERYGISPKYAPWIRDASSLLLGSVGAGVGQGLGDLAKPISLEVPKKLDLPLGFKVGYDNSPIIEKGPSVPMSQSPYADQYAAARAQARANARLALLPQGETPAETPFPKPLRPLVGTPEDWQSYDQQMSIIKPEASDAGMYHAARGATGRRLNLQRRIGGKF